MRTRWWLGAIGIGLLLPATPVAANPAAFTFVDPNPGWVPLTLAAAPIEDAEGDTDGALDVVGDATSPMAFVAADTMHVYFRVRVDSDPLAAPTEFAALGWGCVIDVDGDPQTYEVSTIIDGVVADDPIALYRNTTTTVANSPTDDPDDPASSVVTAPLTVRVGHAQVTAAESMFGGDADFFITWAIERSAVAAAGYTASEPASFFCGSGNGGTKLDADCAGATCELAAAFSDYVTCEPTGCVTCGAFADCVECVDDDGCPGGACDVTTHTCVECVDDGHCVGSVCDVTSHTCVECADDGDCPVGVCDETVFECVDCVGDQDCVVGVCHETANVCVECLDVEDCLGNETCDFGTNTCIPGDEECTTDEDCFDGEHCETTTDQCVECVLNSHCDSFRCDTSSNTCGTCSADADCDPDRVCESGACVVPSGDFGGGDGCSTQPGPSSPGLLFAAFGLIGLGAVRIRRGARSRL